MKNYYKKSLFGWYVRYRTLQKANALRQQFAIKKATDTPLSNAPPTSLS